MSIKNITRLYNVAYNSIFTYNGALPYTRVTECIIKVVNMVANTETDEFTLTDIGEHNEACLADLIIGAFWHYIEWHGGQDSQGYVALSALGQVFSPGMADGPEEETGEHDAYEMLNQLAGGYYNARL